MSSRCDSWPPKRRSQPLAVAVPGSVLSVEHGLQAKTFKAGIIGRALAIYRVDEVIVYRDPDTDRSDQNLLALLLGYMATPPHLRKKLYPLDDRLRYVGLLPPLRIASHDAPLRPQSGAVMEGLVEECSGRSCRVYLGGLGDGVLRARRSLREGDVVTVRIIAARRGVIEVEEASWGNVYTGFAVRRAGRLEGLVSSYRKRGFRVVAASRLGDCISEPRIQSRLVSMLGDAVLVVFGGPRRGVLEFTSPRMYDAVVNFIPWQGVETVRTEEALHASLSLINMLAEAQLFSSLDERGEEELKRSGGNRD